RPQDRIAVNRAKEQFHADLKNYVLDGQDIEESPVDEELADTFPASDSPSHDAHEEGSPLGHSTSSPVAESKRAHKLVDVTAPDGATYQRDHGRVSIASLPSCTNTSNPEVMLAAG